MTAPVSPISLIFTVLNEAQVMRSFLESISSQTRLPAEIVIVDGGSVDGTIDRIESWNPPPNVHLQVRVIEGANISQGRNAAIRMATHEYIAISDAGTSLSPNWLNDLYVALDSGADVASGFFNSAGSHFWEKTIGSVITPKLSEIDPETFLPSSRSVALRKSAWTKADGYPEWLDYCEDLVFDLALKERHSKFVFVPGALATWNARPSLRAFAKQYFRYARGDGKAGLWAKRHIARYVAYLLALVLLVLSASSGWAALALAVLALIYLSKFFRRVVSSRRSLGSQTVLSAAAVPLVVVIGDVAKMAGYPVGLRWRRKFNQVGTAQ